MVTAKVTSKGQITIPKSVRDSLHLKPGNRIEVVVHDDNEAILR
ncbi:MAG: AbrB/MazE/SpoVT family DNA-binding domain-containing protein, partial [Planctomycetota bacterium]